MLRPLRNSPAPARKRLTGTSDSRTYYERICYGSARAAVAVLALLQTAVQPDATCASFPGQARSSSPSAAQSRTTAKPDSARKSDGARTRVGRLPEPAAATNFLTADQLQQLPPVSYSGINTPLRQAVRKLSETLRVAIVVDRRVDPDQVVDLDLVDVPLAEALQQIAKQAGAGATILGPVVYLGPVDSARQLRTLGALSTQAAGRLPARQKQAALASRPLAWPALATPAQVFERLSKESGIPIHGGDRLPHDLLAATDLPAMPWIDRLSLTAIQFGLAPRFAVDGRSVELAPIPDEVRISRSYPAGREAAATVAEWKRLAPEAEIKPAQGKIMVLATVEDHERLVPPRAARSPAATPGQQVYTLTLEGMPLEAFIAQLEQKLALSFDLDPAGVNLEAPVSVDVREASLDELLRAAFDPLGLDFTRKDKRVTVRVRTK